MMMSTKAERKKASEREIKQRKRQERWETRQFLECLGYQVTAIRSSEKPDTIAYVIKDGVKQKIGIEHTSYVVDAVHGQPSMGMRYHNVWQRIQASINHRLSHLPELEHTAGWVLFMRGNPPAEECVRDLAGEIIALAREFPLAPGEQKTFQGSQRCEPRRPPGIAMPTHYPLLCQYIEQVRLQGTECSVRLWPCLNTSSSCVGLSTKHVVEIIKAYNSKSTKYVWGNVDERWLLIAAPGYPVFKTAGPHPEWFEWDCLEIKAACRAPGFDRIYFWDRMYCWHKEIYPGAPIVKKEWRAQASAGDTKDGSQL